ncbi:MAG: hypothetical protein QW451_02595 [Candidatus Aenigmatarchaeota archaeon]
MEVKEAKKKKCVLIDCDRTAVGVCNNCGLPICDKHSRKIGQFYICVNCYEYTKKLRPSKLPW